MVTHQQACFELAWFDASATPPAAPQDSQLCLDMHYMGPQWPPVASSSGGGSSKRSGGGGSSGKQTAAGSGGSGSGSGGSGGRWAPRGGLGGLADALLPAAPRGRVLFITDQRSTTSGRRIGAWGPLRATAIHVAISVAWYLMNDPQRVEALYERLYTDAYR